MHVVHADNKADFAASIALTWIKTQMTGDGSPCAQGRVGVAVRRFAPQLRRNMRNALEEVMAKVPLGYSTLAVKVYLAEWIPKAAAQGHANYNDLIAVATDQIQRAISLLT
jgi:hypothetical protein